MTITIEMLVQRVEVLEKNISALIDNMKINNNSKNNITNIKNVAVCITAGEQSENHVGMKINGKGIAKSGFSIEDLIQYKALLEEKMIVSEYYRLDNMLEGDDKEDVEPAALLIIRNGINQLLDETADNMLLEQLKLDWDKKYWDNRRQRVLNKSAIYNLCYGNQNQAPDYDNKQGRIVAYKELPILSKWRDVVGNIFGEKAKNLEMEGNLYYDEKCGIGFHGDGERKKVIACSLGKSRPIHWQWYYKYKPIGKRIEFELHNGDVYIMSEKTSGFDWKTKNTKTLRHAAGAKAC